MRNLSASDTFSVAALLGLGAIISATGLPADYVFDDVIDIARNPAASPAGFTGSLPSTVRPVLKASYAATAALLGAGAPAQRAVNIVLHLAVTGLVYLIFRRLSACDDRASRRWVPLVGAAVWALHPVLVETVTYVSGRSMGLSSLLLLAAFVLATGERGPVGARWFATFVLAFLAPLARETALVLPALLLLWQLTLAVHEPSRHALRRQLPVWLGVAGAAFLLALMPRHRELLAFSLRAREPVDALLGNVHAVSVMLGLWIRPWEISIDPAAPAVYGWHEYATLWRVGMLGVAATLAFAVRRRAPVAAFGIGWTLLNLLPTNSIIWRIDPVGTRPLYLASLAPALAVAWVLAPRPGMRRGFAVASVLASSVLLMALCGATLSRVALYRSPAALWADAAAKAPEKARPHANLGLLYLQAGRLDEAERALKTAIDLEPWDREAACALEAVTIQRRGADSIPLPAKGESR